MRWLASIYYGAMRRITKTSEGLRQLRKRCCRCGIHFFTSQSNRKRKDLRCPFGCRKERERETSNKRGLAHYRTPKGRQAKFELNRNRSLLSEQALTMDKATCPLEFTIPIELLRYVVLLVQLSGQPQVPRSEIESTAKEMLNWVRMMILRQRRLQDRGG